MRHGRLSLDPKDIVAIDEAGRVDTRRWGRLAEARTGADSPTLVAGDEAQVLARDPGDDTPHQIKRRHLGSRVERGTVSIGREVQPEGQLAGSRLAAHTVGAR